MTPRPITIHGTIVLTALGLRATVYHCPRRIPEDVRGSFTTTTFLEHARTGGSAFSKQGRNPAPERYAVGPCPIKGGQRDVFTKAPPH